jgi:hypothetical protein
LWTLPLAWVIGVVLWLYQRTEWCGYGGCWAQSFNFFFPQSGFLVGILLSIVGGLVVVAAVVVPPWLWPWWTRLIIALPLAAFDIYYFGWGNSPSIIPIIPTLRSEFF